MCRSSSYVKMTCDKCLSKRSQRFFSSNATCSQNTVEQIVDILVPNMRRMPKKSGKPRSAHHGAKHQRYGDKDQVQEHVGEDVKTIPEERGPNCEVFQEIPQHFSSERMQGFFNACVQQRESLKQEKIVDAVSEIRGSDHRSSGVLKKFSCQTTKVEIFACKKQQRIVQ